MKRFKWTRFATIALVMAIGMAGSIYTGYWSRMERYVASIVDPASVEAPAWVRAAPGPEGGPAEGSAPAAAASGGQSMHGGPQAAGFDASLLPRIAGYATVLGLFSALVRLVGLLLKRRPAARRTGGRLAVSPAAASAVDVAEVAAR